MATMHDSIEKIKVIGKKYHILSQSRTKKEKLCIIENKLIVFTLTIVN